MQTYESSIKKNYGSDLPLLKNDRARGRKGHQNNQQQMMQIDSSSGAKHNYGEVELGEYPPGYDKQMKAEMAGEVMDMEMGVKQRKPFTREDFRVMINETYSQFYGKFIDQYNPDEFITCVDDEELV